MRKIFITSLVMFGILRIASGQSTPTVITVGYLSSTQIDNIEFDKVNRAKKVSVVSSTLAPVNVNIVTPTTFPLPSAQVTDLKSVDVLSLPTISGTVSVNNFPSEYPLPASQVTDLKDVTVSNAFALESTLSTIDGKISTCDTSNIAGTVSVDNFPTDYYKGGNISVMVTSGSLDANVSGSVSVSNFPSTQTIADERYQTKVSSGAAGKITGVTSATIVVADAVEYVSFSLDDLASPDNHALIQNDKTAAEWYLKDGKIINKAITVPMAMTFQLSNLSVSSTIYYDISTLK